MKKAVFMFIALIILITASGCLQGEETTARFKEIESRQGVEENSFAPPTNIQRNNLLNELQAYSNELSSSNALNAAEIKLLVDSKISYLKGINSFNEGRKALSEQSQVQLDCFGALSAAKRQFNLALNNLNEAERNLNTLLGKQLKEETLIEADRLSIAVSSFKALLSDGINNINEACSFQ
ncbi:MAG TPA: hypothetical protein VJK05_04615 [archaeon]|nr:hypothetical protein [archaeon]